MTGSFRTPDIAARVCLAIAVAACSPPTSAPRGRVLVAVTLDWEGVDISTEGLDALTNVRRALGAAPMTHFISAAYFAKDDPPASFATAIRPGDEVGVHLHASSALVRASGLPPRTSPSFFNGTDQLLGLEAGDAGLDIDLDTYDVPALRAMLRTSRRLLERAGVTASKSFRAGGYLATPKVRLAIANEGYATDSSAIDYRQLHESDEDFLRERLAEIWPKLEPTTQPFLLRAGATQLVELPIAAVLDYTSVAEVVQVFESAHRRLTQHPGQDVFVVLAFHLETADEFAARLVEAIAAIRARPELARELSFVTIDQAAELARFVVSAL